MLSEREPESGLGLIDRLLRRSGLDGEAALPDARKLGRRMAALYRRWQRSGGPDLPRLTEALLHHIGVPADTPLGATCREAALAVSRWEGGAYHSARHHAEVATNAIVLATIDARLGGRLPAHDLGLLLAAALAHDIHFEPARNSRARFAAETRSAEALDEIAARCGLDADDRRRVHLLVLATEPRSRPELGLLIGDAQAAANLPPLLTPLLGEPSLLPLAALLSDADLLSSAGLTRAWARVQGDRLARESRRPIGKAEWRHFLDDIVGPGFLSDGGRHFAANLARIRNALAAANSS